MPKPVLINQTISKPRNPWQKLTLDYFRSQTTKAKGTWRSILRKRLLKNHVFVVERFIASHQTKTISTPVDDEVDGSILKWSDGMKLLNDL